MADDWIQDLITVLTKALKDDGKIQFSKPDGKTVVIKIGKDVITLIQQNRHRLIQVGKQTFEDYLLAKSRGEEFDALVLIYDKIDIVELVEKAKENAAQLKELAVRIQETRRFWLAFGKQVGTKVAMGLLSIILV